MDIILSILTKLFTHLPICLSLGLRQGLTNTDRELLQRVSGGENIEVMQRQQPFN